MNIGGIPPCGHTLATHRGLSLAWGVYPLLCRDTEDYRIPPAVSRHTGGIPLAWGVYPLLCRDTEDYRIPPSVSRHRRLSYTPCCVATQEGYTPSCVATQKIIVYPLLCRDTQGGIPLMRGVYPLLCRDTEDYTPSVVCPPVSRHMGGIPPPRHRAHNPAVPSGHFHDTTHNTSSGVNQWS